MDFILTFAGIKSPLIPDRKCECLGISDLDFVRKQLPFKKIDHTMITNSCCNSKWRHQINLTERQARSALVFAESNHVDVFCENDSFSIFLKRQVEPEYNYGWIFKSIKRVYISVKPDNNLVFGTWLKHGCPFLWDPRNENGQPSKEFIKRYEVALKKGEIDE